MDKETVKKRMTEFNKSVKGLDPGTKPFEIKNRKAVEFVLANRKEFESVMKDAIDKIILDAAYAGVDTTQFGQAFSLIKGVINAHDVNLMLVKKNEEKLKKRNKE